MQLCRITLKNGSIRAAIIEGTQVHLLDLTRDPRYPTLSAILHADDPAGAAESLRDRSVAAPSMGDVNFLAPVDTQEVWAAGVTYKRSREARERESVGAARFYDLVYTAPRPELFFKATARRVVGPGQLVRVRKDSRWSVPEPEVALVISPRMAIVGYTIGNDMSARDIEGENPLYLPQAKVYDQSCSLGPVVTLARAMPSGEQAVIRLTIERGGGTAFEGTTSIAAMARPFTELVEWLGRDNSFPEGVILLTGTGVVPPDDFSLASGDRVHIDISGIGRLTNVVA